jgi:hypothetical protein
MDSATEVAAREALVDFLARTGEDKLVKALAAWGTAPPRGEFDVLDGIAIPRQQILPAADLAADEEARELAGQELVAAIFVLRDTADAPGTGLLYRAILTRDEGGRWHLVRLQSQCTSCFGTGVIEDEMRPCDTCGGEGWGVRLTVPPATSTPVRRSA